MIKIQRLKNISSLKNAFQNFMIAIDNIVFEISLLQSFLFLIFLSLFIFNRKILKIIMFNIFNITALFKHY